MRDIGPEWPAWLRRTVRIAAVLVIVIGGYLLWWSRPINTVGNTAIWFAGDLNPMSSNLEAAYQRLCEAEKGRISEEEFVASEGADYAVLGQGTVFGAGTGGSQTESWADLEARFDFRSELWRLQIIQEPDHIPFTNDWKVCGIQPQS